MGNPVMKISHGSFPYEFAGVRPQGHDGIIKSPDEHRPVAVSHAVIVASAAQKERGELCLIVETVKLPKHMAGRGIEGEYIVVAIGDE